MRRYLLVDDNVELAENLAEILRDVGCAADVAECPARALELLRGQRYDALVTDMRMPVMSGAGLVEEARRLDAGLPVLLVTAHSDETDLERARSAGVLGVLPKPVDVPRFVRALEAARRSALVVVVEDDVALVDNLSELLGDLGFSPVAAGSVSEAAALRCVAPSLALVDLRVPGGPSGAAVDEVRRRYPGVPVVVLTAYAQELPGVEAEATYLKPFDTRGLLDTVLRLHGRGAST